MNRENENLHVGHLMRKRKSANRVIDLLLRTFFVLMPCLIALLVCATQHVDITNLSIKVNDEVGWYTQAFAVAEYGKPIGYWGYNGTHAAVGTYGPWGAGSVNFVAFFLHILKLILPFPDISVYVFNNMLWACMANLAFVIFAKPDRTNLLRLIAVYAFLFVNHSYSFMAMSETTRYSMSVILAGITVFLWKHRTHPRYRLVLFVVTPVMIILFMSAYIMFALLLPVWLYAVYKNSPSASAHKLRFVLLSGLVFFTITGLIYYINGLFSSPYVSNVVTGIISSFQNSFVAGVKYCGYYLLHNIERCTPTYLWSLRRMDYGWPSLYLTVYYIVCLYLVVSFLLRRKRMCNTDWEFHGMGAYMMCGFLCAFIILYDTTTWTLVRGVNIALVYALSLLCMQDKGTEVKGFIIVMLLAIYPFTMFMNNSIVSGREKTEQDIRYQKVFAEYILIEEERNPWENTIALYGDVTRECLELPVGIGINSMISGGANQNARYVMVWVNSLENIAFDQERMVAVIEEMLQTHDILYRDEELILLRNRALALPE